MYIIGITSFYHDSSICLFKNDDLIYACEEERFTGIKHDNTFPKNSLNYIIKKYNLNSNNVESVCYYENPNRKIKRVLGNFLSSPISSYNLTFHQLSEILNNKKQLKNETTIFGDKIYYEKHHYSHIFYSYYTSPFDDCVILSVDGVGENDTIVYAVVRNGNFSIKTINTYPNSLGLFYSAMTSFLGFKPNSGEYKLMGLAGFGDSEKYYEKLGDVVTFNEGKIKVNMKYFDWNKSNEIMFNVNLSELLEVSNRLPEDEITKDHQDIASTVQRIYEENLFKILNHINQNEKMDNLCLSGGSAYNGVANGKLTKKTSFKNLWIPSAPSDAGSSIGSVLGYLKKRNRVKKITTSPFLGPDYGDNDIHHDLKINGLKKYSEDEIYKIISQKLNEGKIVGWYKDKIEFGSRALGHRSIIANPFIPGTRDKLNSIIKKREGFRPFAPMVIWDKQIEYFDCNDYIPYMNQVVNVKSEYRNLLTEVSNIDGTARIQSIKKSDNNIIYNLLEVFSKITNNPPIILNTSFNVRGQTMVLTPKMAYDTFCNTDIDILVINDYILEK
jgi:carbamoyltransferase